MRAVLPNATKSPEWQKPMTPLRRTVRSDRLHWRACLHIDFVSYNAVLQEQSMGIHYNKGAELLDFRKTKRSVWLAATLNR